MTEIGQSVDRGDAERLIAVQTLLAVGLTLVVMLVGSAYVSIEQPLVVGVLPAAPLTAIGIAAILRVHYRM